MKNILTAIIVLTTNFLFSQQFMSKEEFKDSLPESLYNNISSKIDKKWKSSLTKEELYIIKSISNKLSKKITFEWNYSFTDYTYYDNYLNGIKIIVTNNTEKIIKYVKINFQGYNAVGDKVYDGFKTRTGIGPIESYETGTWLFDNCWFSENTVDDIKILSLSIEYMDKTKLLINNVDDFIIDDDIFEKNLKLDLIKDSLMYEYIDSMYNSEKQKFDLKIKKILERNNFIKDSIENIHLNNEFRTIRDSLIISKNKLIELVNKLSKIDSDKKNFLLIMFNKDIDNNINKCKDLIINSTEIETKFDFDNNELLSKNIYKYNEYYKQIQTFLNEPIYKYKIDDNFLDKKLKKTNLYIQNKKIYKEQRFIYENS